MSYRHRVDLEDLPPYTPGRSAASDKLSPERCVIRLASNESPFGPLPSVRTALERAIDSANRYPDFHASALVEALAAKHGVGPDRISVDNGSGGVLQSLALVTAARGDEIVYAWRSFDAYPVVTAVSGARAVTVALEDHRYPLRELSERVTDATRLVIICNPNNPTGTVVSHDEVEAFLEAIPSDVVVVLDEAYREFVTAPDAADGLVLAREHPNVVVLRTFSKAYGLAGLRVGYAVANPHLTRLIRTITVGFSVSTVAQAAAVASLGEAAERELEIRVRSLVAERERVQEILAGWGVPFVPSQANFIYLPVDHESAHVARAFEDRGVVLRHYPGSGLRVTVSTPLENDAFLVAARHVLG